MALSCQFLSPLAAVRLPLTTSLGADMASSDKSDKVWKLEKTVRKAATMLKVLSGHRAAASGSPILSASCSSATPGARPVVYKAILRLLV
jgi:hypothetical protein